MKRYTAYIIPIIAALFAASSCAGWLSVDSEDRILEEKLYSDKDGFYTALNGVYIDLVNANLYSGKLGASTPDILCQYYNTSADSHIYGSLAQYQAEAKRVNVDEIWSRAYFLILNLNKTIWHCEDKKGKVLNDTDYNIIKGEALALRALLHFELFRYFGPVFSSSPGTDAIPYVTSSDPQVNPVLKATEVASLMLSDLDESMRLLKTSDPVISSGKNEVDNGGRNLYNYRNLRMNYFAVKALAARINMYLGYSNYRERALELAEEVISEAAEFFPFTTREEANGQAAVGTPTSSAEDRVFSSDILFAVYNVKRGADIYEKYFSNTLEIKQFLSMTENGFNALYPEESDLRRSNQWQRRKDPLGNDIMCFVKYEAMEVSGKNYPYMIPVLRMSEMYLIAAECYATLPSSKDETLAYERLNAVRNARQTSSVSSALEANIEYEYMREFAGEGQMFWFYKRQNSKTIPAIYDRSQAAVNVQNSNGYMFVLPQSEDGFRK